MVEEKSFGNGKGRLVGMKRKREDFDDFSEEERPIIGTTGIVVIGIVLVVIIVILCLLIWQLNHKDSAGGSADVATAMQSREVFEEGSSQNPQNSSKESEEDRQSTQQASGTETGASSDRQATGAGENNTGLTQMNFRDTDETVTAKDVTNLRTMPGTTDQQYVALQLKNGQTARRTGINDETGWSRLEYDGQVLYAASRLLTTQIESPVDKPSGEPKADKPASNTGTGQDKVVTADGRTIYFLPCDDTVSPKMEVNLRLEPSTSAGNDSVDCRLTYGETAHRTGYDPESGWSRVEYNGKVLYAVTSYLYVPEAAQGNE